MQKSPPKIILLIFIDACQGTDCREDTCGSSRLRRETISLKANIVGRGRVSKGTLTLFLYDLCTARPRKILT